MSIFPFREGEWYSVRDLRETAANILARTASDGEFAAAMRISDLKLYPWSKYWMQEIFPCWLAAGYRTRLLGRRRLQMDAGRRG
jgi:hypothetical protein